MTTSKPKSAAKKLAASKAKSTSAVASKTGKQLKQAINDLEDVRTTISTILQSLRGVSAGELKPAPVAPVDGPSVKGTPF